MSIYTSKAWTPQPTPTPPPPHLRPRLQSVSIGFFMMNPHRANQRYGDSVMPNIRPSISISVDYAEMSNPTPICGYRHRLYPSAISSKILVDAYARNGVRQVSITATSAVIGGLMEDRVENRQHGPRVSATSRFWVNSSQRRNQASKPNSWSFLRPTVIRRQSSRATSANLAGIVAETRFQRTAKVYQPFSAVTARLSGGAREMSLLMDAQKGRSRQAAGPRKSRQRTARLVVDKPHGAATAAFRTPRRNRLP